jgi:hypothetical protein
VSIRDSAKVKERILLLGLFERDGMCRSGQGPLLGQTGGRSRAEIPIRVRGINFPGNMTCGLRVTNPVDTRRLE